MKMYIIPKNVSSRFQFFEGFGWKELLLVVGGLAIGGVLSFILFLITGSIVCFLLTVAGGGLGFFLGKPDPRTGQNALDVATDSRAFNSNPKRYYYRFGSGRE